MSRGSWKRRTGASSAFAIAPWEPPGEFVEVAPGVWEPEGYEATPWELRAAEIHTDDEAWQEYTRCEASLPWFALHHAWTLDVDDPSGVPQWRKFPAYQYLRRFFAAVQVPSNVHVEKSRQMLMSWAWMIVFLWDISFHANWGNMVLSRRQNEVEGTDTTDSLLGKVKHVWLALPPYLQQPLDFKHSVIHHHAIHSFIRGETGTPKAGRGRANKRALMDEAAYIEKSEAIFKGLRQAAKTGTILSSTPNGKGNVFARIRFSSTTTFHKMSFHWIEHPRKCEGLFCSCGWQATSIAHAKEEFDAHECGNRLLEKPLPPEPHSPWYDREGQDLTPEGVASELDISYERSRRGRVFASFDSTRQVLELQTLVGERQIGESQDAYRVRYLKKALLPNLPCVVGMDFGVDDPSSLVLGQVLNEETMKIRWLDEHEQRNESWEYYHGFINGLWAPIVKEVTGLDLLYYGDPSGKARSSDLTSWISNLKSRDPTVVVIIGPKRGSLLEWIDFVHNTIRKRQFEVSSWCTRMIDALNNYHWPVDQDGNPVPGKQLPIHDEWSHCLVGDTQVETDHGPCRLDHVCVGDRVWTRSGLRRVLSSGVTRRQTPVMTVQFSDGRRLTGTPDHKVWGRNGWVELSALRYNDEVCLNERQSSSTARPSTAIQRQEIDRPECTSGGTSEGVSSGCMSPSGKQRMDQCRQGISYITSIGIRSITSWRILRVCLVGSMEPCIAGGISPLSISPSSLRRGSKSGTGRLLGGSTTVGWRSVSGRFVSRVRSAVSNAAPRRWPSFVESFAAMRVSLSGGDDPALIISRGCVAAEHGSSATDTRASTSARGAVATAIASWESGTADVYCLTVEHDHEFYANGVLVQNCMSAFRYVYEFRYWSRLPDLDRRVVTAGNILALDDDILVPASEESPDPNRLKPIPNPKPDPPARLSYW